MSRRKGVKMDDFRKVMEQAGMSEGAWGKVEGGKRTGNPKIITQQQELWSQVSALLHAQVAKDRREVKCLLEKCNRLKCGGVA